MEGCVYSRVSLLAPGLRPMHSGEWAAYALTSEITKRVSAPETTRPLLFLWVFKCLSLVTQRPYGVGGAVIRPRRDKGLPFGG